MTISEKIEMYKGKQAFINYLSKAFESRPAGSSVAKVEYEVYEKEIDESTTYFAEFLVVTFDGGAKSVRNVNGNSNMTNLVELGKLVNGGYYDEVEYYRSLTNNGFSLVVFN